MTSRETDVGDGLRSDNPEAYIPRDRRRALAAGTRMPDRVRGAGLFADISGFTPLTEALATELGPQRGAEVLATILGDVISAVIDELDRFGGDVIYFSGDAITCWIDADDGRRATACALAMQAAMTRVGSVTTPGGHPVVLAMKVAVAVGSARRFVVGVPRVQLIDVLAGRLVDQLADAEHHAQKGEVVLDESALDALSDMVELAEVRRDPAGGRRFGVVRRLLVDVPDARVEEPPALPESLVRQWLLPAVYERMRTGRGEFLAELRAAYPLFLRFGGIDYDDDDDAAIKLDAFVSRAQEILDGYGGNALQLTLGDKGAYLYAVFGAPLAHEDDAARVASAALELLGLEATTAATEIQVGITHGRLRSGTYGHPMRRTFVCLGDAVNLSARLMSAAPAGRIFVSRTVREEAGEAFTWETLASLSVKGKSEPVEAFALIGAVGRTSRRQTRFELPLVGRRAELRELDSRLDRTRTGVGQVVGIAAEAGMGKSRLVAEFVRSVRRAGLRVAFGESQAFGTSTSYLAWREVWRGLFGVDDAADPGRQRNAIESVLRAIDPSLSPRAPLLEAVVGVPIPDTALTAAFDPKLRKASLEDLLARCLTALATDPLVIVLEDCHWIDELSKDLLAALVRSSVGSPVCFVLAYRPAASAGGGLGLERLPQFVEIRLAKLDADETRQIIRSKLGQLIGGDRAIPETLVELITARAEGNPFYVEELLNYLVTHGVDPADERALAALDLPNSLQSLILSRIDQLDEAPRRTLKVASVLGRVFQAAVLPRVYPEIGPLEVVTAQLDQLRSQDLIAFDREADQAYLFRHVLTQTVAYESMPFVLRAALHRRVGADLERTAGDAIDHQLDLLAYHYWHGDDEAKKREYLGRAGTAAQAGYANTAAIDYYGRLVPLLPATEQGTVLLKLGKVLELVGDWGRAETVAGEALALAVAADDAAAEGWAQAALAEIARRNGQYDTATEHLDTAADRFQAVGDEAGVGQVLHLAGTVAAQRGDLGLARQRYEESLAIRERLDDRAGMGGLYSNLAIVAEYGGDYGTARQHNERALELRTAIGDRRGIGVSENNIGMIALHEGQLHEARDHFELAIRLCREVGDRWMVALAQNNLGNALRGLGDLGGAAERYDAALRADRELDDRWAISFLLEDIGVLAARAGRAVDAFEIVGAAETLRAEIGSPRGPALEAELGEHLAAARAVLGDPAADAAVARGRQLDTAAAINAALEISRPEARDRAE